MVFLMLNKILLLFFANFISCSTGTIVLNTKRNANGDCIESVPEWDNTDLNSIEIQFKINGWNSPDLEQVDVNFFLEVHNGQNITINWIQRVKNQEKINFSSQLGRLELCNSNGENFKVNIFLEVSGCTENIKRQVTNMVDWNSEREYIKALSDSKTSVNASFRIENGSMIVDNWGALSNLSACSEISYIRLQNEQNYYLSEKVYKTSFLVFSNLAEIVLTKNDCSERNYYLEMEYKDFYKNNKLQKVLFGHLKTNFHAAAIFFKNLTSMDITTNNTGIYFSRKIQWPRMGCNPSLQIFSLKDSYYHPLTSTFQRTQDFPFFPFDTQTGHCYISAGYPITVWLNDVKDIPLPISKGTNVNPVVVNENEDEIIIKLETSNEDCYDQLELHSDKNFIVTISPNIIDNQRMFLIPKTSYCLSQLVFKSKIGSYIESELSGLDLALNYNASSNTLTLSTLRFKVFQKCQYLTLKLLCYSEGNLEVEKQITASYGKYVADNSIKNMSCKVYHLGLESNLEFVGSDLAVASSISQYGLVGISLFLIFCLVAAFLVVRLKINPTGLTVLKFNRRPIKQNIDSALKEDQALKMEFLSIENTSLNEIYKKDTSLVGKNPVNRKRNRYNDIIPFDSNIVTLSEKTGEPPSTYMNCSFIKFPGLKKTFLAAQAPPKGTIPLFWQLVFEQSVKNIIMLTSLTEKDRKKADQYWPDKDNPEVELPSGVVRHLSTNFIGTMYVRKLSLEIGKEKSVISLLHTEDWKDKTAPKDTSFLIDMVHQTVETWTGDEPLLVHCSAGVGRTGTFIAVYKLYMDLQMNKLKENSVYETVLHMRHQRMKMVQNEDQYIYVHKCIRNLMSYDDYEYVN